MSTVTKFEVGKKYRRGTKGTPFTVKFIGEGTSSRTPLVVRHDGYSTDVAVELYLRDGFEEVPARYIVELRLPQTGERFISNSGVSTAHFNFTHDQHPVIVGEA